MITTRSQKRMRDYFTDESSMNENGEDDESSHATEDAIAGKTQIRNLNPIIRSNCKLFSSNYIETSKNNDGSKNKKISIPKLLDGKYFTIVTMENNKVDVTCNTCGEQRKGDIRSTGNFMTHIRKDHDHLVNEVEQYKSKRGSTTDEEGNKRKRQKLIDDMLKGFTTEQVS